MVRGDAATRANPPGTRAVFAVRGIPLALTILTLILNGGAGTGILPSPSNRVWGAQLPPENSNEKPANANADGNSPSDPAAIDPSSPDALDRELQRRNELTKKDPLVFLRSRIAPSEVIPFAKDKHWNWVMVQLRANRLDYPEDDSTGILRLEEIPLEGMPQSLMYQTAVKLKKDQDGTFGFPIWMTQVRNREFNLELARSDDDRADLQSSVAVRRLEPHQMLVVCLTGNPDRFSRWTQFQATIPISGTDDPVSVDKQRYYRIITSREPWRALLSPQSLTWTTTSHLIWDLNGNSMITPNALSNDQQRAMIEWLHWGGQLILITSGAGGAATFGVFQESFLGPFLPATLTGETPKMTDEELDLLSRSYLPPRWPDNRAMNRGSVFEDDEERNFRVQNNIQREQERELSGNLRYYLPEKIPVIPKEPVYLTGLKPKPESITIPAGKGNRPWAVEWRVGRGRVTVLGLDPNSPALRLWRGRDTFVRRVVLRRPEEIQDSFGKFAFLGGPRLCWLQYLCRDLGSRPASSPIAGDNAARGLGAARNPNIPAPPPAQYPPSFGSTYSVYADVPDEDIRSLQRDSVAAWDDQAEIPALCQKQLVLASGIVTPSRWFVIQILFSYIVLLIPVNWLFCRYVLKRREWAWAMAPLLSLGFAVFVERAAARNLGFDARADEIAVLETQSDYNYAHVSRFVAICNTGRVEYRIEYPEEESTLILPMNAGVGLRGQVLDLNRFQKSPIPSLSGFVVQPRSLSLFRAEQMLALGGAVTMDNPRKPANVQNHSKLTLRDAVLVNVDQRVFASLGTLAPGAVIPLDTLTYSPLPAPPAATAGTAGTADAAVTSETAEAAETASEHPLRNAGFKERLMRYQTGRIEDGGEWRLVAEVDWPEGHAPGQVITPLVDQKRGIMYVVCHLRFDPPPAPDRFEYDNFAILPNQKPE